MIAPCRLRLKKRIGKITVPNENDSFGHGLYTHFYVKQSSWLLLYNTRNLTRYTCTAGSASDLLCDFGLAT